MAKFNGEAPKAGDPVNIFNCSDPVNFKCEAVEPIILFSNLVFVVNYVEEACRVVTCFAAIKD